MRFLTFGATLSVTELREAPPFAKSIELEGGKTGEGGNMTAKHLRRDV